MNVENHNMPENLVHSLQIICRSMNYSSTDTSVFPPKKSVTLASSFVPKRRPANHYCKSLNAAQKPK